MESLRMLELMGPLMMMYAALVALAVPFVIYVIARWRANRDQITDPHLGIKVALGYFAITAFQILLAGLALFFYAVLASEPSDEKSAMYRGALGLILPGGIVLAAHSALLGRTNQLAFPSVRRLLLGFNLFLTGTVGFIALVLAFEALFAKSGSGSMGRVAGAMVLVYGSAWAAVGVQFGRVALAGGSAGDEPPASSSGGRAATAPPAGPQLPALGGGAFPPIDQK